MKLIIVRHGDPDYANDTLTEKGHREAKLLADRLSKLDVSAVYCSPLGRAQDTAAYTLEKLGMQAVTYKWLREFKGKIIVDGKRISCWDRLPSYWTQNPDYYDVDKWYKTELMQSASVEKQYTKVCRGIDNLLKAHGYEHCGNYYKVVRPNHDTVILFCHFGVECVILSRIFSISPMILWHHFAAQPSSVTTLFTEEREQGIAVFRCMQFGDMSHLYAGNEEPSFAGRFCECFDDDARH